MTALIFGAASLDPATSTILGLIGQLGSASAAVIVVWMFINFWKTDSERRDKQVREQSDEWNRRYDEVLGRVLEALRDNTTSNREFAKSANGICRVPSNYPKV